MPPCCASTRTSPSSAPSPDRIVIGAQQPLAELDADEPTLRGIAALSRGVVRRELEHLLGDEPAAALLDAVAPALQLAPGLLPVLVRGRIPLAAALHRAARQAGHPRPLGSRPPGDALVVPVAAWRLPDAESQRLLAAGDAHLPVVVGDVWVQVGPFVPAGAGCPLCPAPEQPLLLPGHLTPGAERDRGRAGGRHGAGRAAACERRHAAARVGRAHPSARCGGQRRTALAGAVPPPISARNRDGCLTACPECRAQVSDSVRCARVMAT